MKAADQGRRLPLKHGDHAQAGLGADLAIHVKIVIGLETPYGVAKLRGKAS